MLLFIHGNSIQIHQFNRQKMLEIFYFKNSFIIVSIVIAKRTILIYFIK
jgi:hypothetical protein